jgi:hypothetical protein
MKANKSRSKVRVHVEQVFGFQERSMGGKFIRMIGMARAKTKVGMTNLVYNINRHETGQSPDNGPYQQGWWAVKTTEPMGMTNPRDE